MLVTLRGQGVKTRINCQVQYSKRSFHYEETQ